MAELSFGGRLLDVGCGTGEHTLLAASRGADALGVDISPLAVERARAKARERGLAARFEVWDALRIDELGETFDLALDSGLYHVFDDVAIRREYAGRLRAVLTGTLYLMCFSQFEPGDWGPQRISEDELRGSFADGWTIERLERTHFEINPGELTDAPDAWLLVATRS